MACPNPFPRGSLAVVALPLGNPRDITLRALEVLRAADLVAAEDTRTAARLLASYGIGKPLVSYHDWNEAERAESLLRRVEEGARVALVSEAGTPGISDPGYDAVVLARRRGLHVFPVPGPSAAVAFLSVSGLPTHAFTFCGFPPPRGPARRRRFEELAPRTETLVFYESPRRALEALRDAAAAFGPRPCALGREITKPHEEFLFGTVAEVAERLAQRPSVRGEICWGVAGAGRRPAAQTGQEPLAEAVAEALASGLPLKAAARELASRLGLPAKRAYQLLLEGRALASGPP